MGAFEKFIESEAFFPVLCGLLLLLVLVFVWVLFSGKSGSRKKRKYKKNVQLDETAVIKIVKEEHVEEPNYDEVPEDAPVIKIPVYEMDDSPIVVPEGPAIMEVEPVSEDEIVDLKIPDGNYKEEITNDVQVNIDRNVTPMVQEKVEPSEIVHLEFPKPEVEQFNPNDAIVVEDTNPNPIKESELVNEVIEMPEKIKTIEMNNEEFNIPNEISKENIEATIPITNVNSMFESRTEDKIVEKPMIFDTTNNIVSPIDNFVVSDNVVDKVNDIVVPEIKEIVPVVKEQQIETGRTVNETTNVAFSSLPTSNTEINENIIAPEIKENIGEKTEIFEFPDFSDIPDFNEEEVELPIIKDNVNKD